MHTRTVRRTKILGIRLTMSASGTLVSQACTRNQVIDGSHTMGSRGRRKNNAVGISRIKSIRREKSKLGNGAVPTRMFALLLQVVVSLEWVFQKLTRV